MADKTLKIREVEDNETIDVSISQAKAFLNRIIDRVYDIGPDTLSIIEMCHIADSYALLAQVCLRQQETDHLDVISDLLADVIKGDDVLRTFETRR